jgi:hypothetical protein
MQDAGRTWTRGCNMQVAIDASVMQEAQKDGQVCLKLKTQRFAGRTERSRNGRAPVRLMICYWLGAADSRGAQVLRRTRVLWSPSIATALRPPGGP